jgi:hypothetical protein
MDPFRLLKDAIRAVPAVKYALGVGGIAAVVAIVLGFGLNPQVAVFGTLIVLGLMFLLVVFSRYQNQGRISTGGPAEVLVWFYTLAVMATTILFMTSYFWHWPIKFEANTIISLRSGSVTLYDGFRFPDQSTFKFSSEQIERWGTADADIGVANPNPANTAAELFLMNDYPPYTDLNATQHGVVNAGIHDMHVQGLDLVKEAPPADYVAHYVPPIVDHVYCIRTSDGHHYAKIKISGVEKDRISFDYIFQPDGTRNLLH